MRQLYKAEKKKKKNGGAKIELRATAWWFEYTYEIGKHTIIAEMGTKHIAQLLQQN